VCHPIHAREVTNAVTIARKIVVLGAGGTGLYMADIVEQADGCQFAGFLDDDASKRPEDCCGYPVLGPLFEWRRLPGEYAFLTSLYGPQTNPHFSRLVESLRIPEERWATVVDQRAAVSRHASLSPGCFVGPGSVIEPMATMGPRSALLGNAYMAHHTRLGEYVACGNSACLAGSVTIGKATFIGANAAIREYTVVGAGCVVGMGAVVIHEVRNGQTVVGNPARPVERADFHPAS